MMNKSASSDKAKDDALMEKLAKLEAKKIKQKECETRALRIVERLLDNPVDEEFLKDACQFLSRGHYEDVVEERALDELCGYPLCPRSVNTKRPAKKYHISTRTNKVYDITERKNFCSNGCYKASTYLTNQISTSSVWSRDHEQKVQFLLLPPGGASSLAGGKIVVDHPGAQLASELASGLSLVAENSSTNHSRRSEATNGRACSKTDQLTSSVSPAMSDEEESAEITEANPRSGLTDLDRDDNESDGCQNADNVGSTRRNVGGSERKLHELMKLIDRRDKLLIKRSRKTEKGEESSGSETGKRDEEDIIRTKTEDWKSSIERKIPFESVPVRIDSSGDGKESLEPFPREKKSSKIRLAPRQKIEKFLQEWITPRSLELLEGKSNVDRVEESGRSSLETKFGNEERIERLLERREMQEKPSRSVPDVQSLKCSRDEQLFEIKVREFYAGGRQFTRDGNKKRDSGDDVIEERDDADWTKLVVPPVDSQSQSLIRRRIVMDALSKTLPSVLTLLTLRNDDVVPQLKTLVRTFDLTRENVVLKPSEWSLMTVYLLRLLARYNDLVNEAFASRHKEIGDVISAYDVTIDDLSEGVSGVFVKR